MELKQYAKTVAKNARQASIELATATGDQKLNWLKRCAAELVARADEIVAANAKDLTAAEEKGLSSAMIDRLRLTPERLQNLADAVVEIGQLPDPVGEIFESCKRPNGLLVTKVRVPLGVVFFIYESRPNVTVDAAALCVKSGNAVILRGGSEAFHSNTVLYSVLKDCLKAEGLPENAVQLVETTDRAAVGEFLAKGDLIDVTIPRGGKSLIERVAREATMPVIKHFDGICHVYIDASADQAMATDITVNSKCQRPGVCNAAETLLIHKDAAARFWPALAAELQSKGVELRCCSESAKGIKDAKAATDEDYGTEYLELILSVKIVDSIEEAAGHIRQFGSGHTESIVTNSLQAAEYFQNQVDSSAVIVNASTRFNDGGEFGLGAEIGISTDRFHARGPCGLREIMSYKYVVHGTGQIRN
ncbi:glutamate-5-semialdehyde dehydrogenase [Fuerstiella marisgermanici]|uniref:Gamma-glutamyl phosphate reductase n=1 Tax=Fuerstiella marisgermanici TaxID=1891926 RepID=A0A1P8W8N4_9PLAN|nr:glutamate-5-semialdehyde dehydrogenase [Fuerstiella marisgermanici]APZ90434.1 Gamma-glutamyl phosphate reductase [Fuerstiella marisgermanici]